MSITISRLTTEYLFWDITTPNDLSSSTVELAFMDSPNNIPESSDWLSADLIDAPAEPKIRKLVGPENDGHDLTPSSSNEEDYQVWAKVIDNPEVPVRRLGVVTVQ